jgi:hypothetical protein
MEEWRPINGFPDYAVSNLGRIKRLTKGKGTYPGRMRHPTISSAGYFQVGLCGTKKLVHQIVAEAFLGAKPPGHHCHHTNGRKLENYPHNLEYLEEGIHNGMAFKHCTPKLRGHPKLSESEVREVRKLAQMGISRKNLTVRFGVKEHCIRKIINRQSWQWVE